jgi:hypothetical protein
MIVLVDYGAKAKFDISEKAFCGVRMSGPGGHLELPHP